MPTWTMDEHVARAFNGMPLAVLMLIDSGDLQKELPNWLTLFSAARDALPSMLNPDSKNSMAWREVLKAYDAKMEAHEAQRAENP